MTPLPAIGIQAVGPVTVDHILGRDQQCVLRPLSGPHPRPVAQLPVEVRCAMRECALGNVLWIGGGSGSGKSSLARAITRRYDVELYAADARAYAHLARTTGSDRPAETPDARWLVPTPEELAARFLAAAAEKFPLVLEDLTARDGDTLVIAEGPTMLPNLISAHMSSADHALFVVPTDEFSERMLMRRGGGRTLGTSDPERAHATLLARNRILNRTIRDGARALGFPVIEVDGSLTLSETERLVAERFRPVLNAGPRAATGRARRRIRRRENAAMHANALAYLRDIGVEDMVAAPPLPFACECLRLGCTVEISVSPGAFSAVLAHPEWYMITGGHTADGETVVDTVGEEVVVVVQPEP